MSLRWTKGGMEKKLESVRDKIVESFEELLPKEQRDELKSKLTSTLEKEKASRRRSLVYQESSAASQSVHLAVSACEVNNVCCKQNNNLWIYDSPCTHAPRKALETDSPSSQAQRKALQSDPVQLSQGFQLVDEGQSSKTLPKELNYEKAEKVNLKMFALWIPR